MVNQKKALASTTILTLLSRLEKKQFISVKKEGKVNYYTPLISREEYQQNEAALLSWIRAAMHYLGFQAIRECFKRIHKTDSL